MTRWLLVAVPLIALENQISTAVGQAQVPLCALLLSLYLSLCVYVLDSQDLEFNSASTLSNERWRSFNESERASYLFKASLLSVKSRSLWIAAFALCFVFCRNTFLGVWPELWNSGTRCRIPVSSLTRISASWLSAEDERGKAITTSGNRSTRKRDQSLVRYVTLLLWK